jgi:hypothetical protein
MVTLDYVGFAHHLSHPDLTGLARMMGDQGRGKLNWLHRIRDQKKLAMERGEEISDEEARRREVAKLHRPRLKVPIYNPDRYGPLYNPRLYDGAEVMLSQGRVALPNCVPLEPKAVHAKRNYDKITTEVARMIEEGNAQPEEIRFMCSEFFVWVRNGEEFLIRFGERRIPSRINKKKLNVCYVDSTIALDGNTPIKLKSSVAVFDYYLGLYCNICGQSLHDD